MSAGEESIAYELNQLRKDGIIIQVDTSEELILGPEERETMWGIQAELKRLNASLELLAQPFFVRWWRYVRRG